MVKVIVMVTNLYSAFSIYIFKCAFQASDLWVISDISIIIQALLAAAISPLVISPSALMNEMRLHYNTGNYMPYSTQDCVNSDGLCDGAYGL